MVVTAPPHAEARPRYRHHPNDEGDRAAVLHWLGYADYYTFPHVLLFHDLSHLRQLLTETDFPAVSRAMCAFSARQEDDLVQGWARLLDRVAPAASRPVMEPGLPHRESMDRVYGRGGWQAYCEACRCR